MYFTSQYIEAHGALVITVLVDIDVPAIRPGEEVKYKRVFRIGWTDD